MKLSLIRIALLIAMPATGALAQSPNQPIKILVPISVGGGPDLAPESIVAKLRTELNKLLGETDVKEKLNKAGGLQAYVTTPREFAEIIRRDSEKYAKVVAAIGLRMD